MSGHGTIDTAVEATRIGAYAFLEKPIALQKLLSTVGQALRQPAPAAQPAALSLAYLGKAPRSSRELKQRLETVKALKLPVLLTGEPGCGKSLCARFLHQANTPWVAPDELRHPRRSRQQPRRPGRGGHPVPARSERPHAARSSATCWRRLAKLERYHTRLICSTSRPLARLVAEAASTRACMRRSARSSCVCPACASIPRTSPSWPS